MTTTEAQLRTFLQRVLRRRQLVAACHGAALGFLLAALLLLVATGRHWPLTGAALAGVAVVIALSVTGWTRTTRSLVAAAAIVERRAPECRNLVRTAAELMERSAAPRTLAHVRVCTQALSRTGTLSADALVPSGRAIGVTGVAALGWALLLLVLSPVAAPLRHELQVVRALAPGAPLTIAAIDVVVTPPRYTAVPPTRLSDPGRVEAMVGSRVQFSVRSNATTMHMVHGADTIPLVRADDRFVGNVDIERDGFVVLVGTREDAPGSRQRLVGITATSDEAPRVRITAPGRDLFLPAAEGSIDVAVEAIDDIALTSLRLRYTKVSGSGERFTFADGELPLVVQRRGAREWTATARLPLGSMTLAAGDMVVYRAVAADARPGGTPSESDAFIAEIMAPGGEAADGFAVDPDQERYAVSQQMLILKTERLIARQRGMTADDLLEASRELAMEQRRVRAEFVFMMGGEFAAEIAAEESMDDLDESHEAEAEGDLSAGRMVNQGRAALLAAIRSMSRAASALTTADLSRALMHERAAVVELEKAFSRTRYILRALTQRERLDLSRRLTGNLTDARSLMQPLPEPLPDESVTQLRSILHELTRLGAHSPGERSERLQRAAIAALAVDASSPRLQQVSSHLSQAATATANERNAPAKALIDSAAAGITRMLRNAHGGAASATPPVEARQLQGALLDALRRAGAR
jgi:hypothetical protein